jgi:hypothetical protein
VAVGVSARLLYLPVLCVFKSTIRDATEYAIRPMPFDNFNARRDTHADATVYTHPRIYSTRSAVMTYV